MTKRLVFAPLAAAMMTGAAATADAACSDADCVKERVTERAFDRALDYAMGFAEQRGSAALGENFQLVGNLRYSADDSEISGEVDAVVPMSFLGGGVGGEQGRALFFQPGFTRYRDDHGTYRTDFRSGAAYRFAFSDATDADVMGVWTFVQQNPVWGHRRVIVGGDYAGAWGRAWFNYFKPTTGWQEGRPGYEERALEGADLEIDAYLTEAFSLVGSASRWEEDDGSGKFSTEGRAGLKWKPDAYWTVRGDYGTDSSPSFGVDFEMPLGGARSSRKLPARTHSAFAGLFRPIDKIGRIELAERELVVDSDGAVRDARVEFLQDEVTSGGWVNLKVTLPVAAPEDTEFTVHLVPGDSDNPAVPEEDFVDEPIRVIVREGERGGFASVQLTLNPAQQEQRMLSARVYLSQLSQ